MFPPAADYPLGSALSSAGGPLQTQGHSGVGEVLTARVVKEDLVVEAQAQLGHAGQEDPHLDGANDLAAQHVAIGTDLGDGEAGVMGRPHSPAAPSRCPSHHPLSWASLTCLRPRGQASFGAGRTCFPSTSTTS